MSGAPFVFELEPLIDEAIERIDAAEAEAGHVRERLVAMERRLAEQRTVHDHWRQRATQSIDDLASAKRTRCSAGSLEALDRRRRAIVRRAHAEAIQLETLGSMRQAIEADLRLALERLATIEDELRGLRRLRERRCREHRRQQEADRERRLDDERTCLAGRPGRGEGRCA